MALSERSRQEMYMAFEEAVGKEPALTLLEHLPPVGWKDVVTMEHLDHKVEALELRIDSMEHQILGKMEHMLRTQLLALAGLYVGSIGAVLTIAKLTH